MATATANRRSTDLNRLQRSCVDVATALRMPNPLIESYPPEAEVRSIAVVGTTIEGTSSKAPHRRHLVVSTA